MTRQGGGWCPPREGIGVDDSTRAAVLAALRVDLDRLWENVVSAEAGDLETAEGVVLVPTFNDPNDRVALNTLAQLFPARQVVGIHAVDLVWGLGTLNCLTQQQPRGR